MKQEQIDILLDSFFITKQDLESRVAFKEFANSLSEIVVNDFLDNYLLNNTHFSIYFSHVDINILKKKFKEFIVYILTQEVNEEYIEKIYFVGSAHFAIEMDPAKVSYGFWAINEVITKMAAVNEIVKEYREVISKLLKFVEHLMNEGFYLKKERQKHQASGEFEGLNIQNELYVGFNLHKLNMQKIEKAISDNDLSRLDSIESESSNCFFGKVLDEIVKDKKYEYLLGKDADKIVELHNSWHKTFVSLRETMLINDNVEEYSQVLQGITSELKDLLDHVIDNSLESGQVALNSGMKSISKMARAFYDKDLKVLDVPEFQNYLYNVINESVLNEFAWAIERIDVRKEDFESSEQNLIVKQIRYKTSNFYIVIEIYQDKVDSYLKEMINLLLEVFRLHLSVNERELSLLEFAEKAESANKSKDMFLANMSHELRTPLNAITGFSQILMMKKDTPESIKKYVDKINIAGNNLLELVNTILDFAKLEAGKMQFEPSLSNISDLLNEVRILITPLAEKKGITIKMPNIVSLNLYIDKTLFKQVLINLLSNAIKFTHTGGEVGLIVVYNADMQKYIFEVKDNGIGLSQEESSKLFQAFSQVDNSYQKEHKGTGLGLMISKKIIEDLHKGSIWVESEKGKGSSFFISMSTPMIESHTYYVKNAPIGSKNILVVEDSESYQKLLIEHLGETYNMTITDTINKSKDLLSKNSYDFIILDFFLTDGISSEILQFMEEEKISIPVIVISAEDEIHISSSLAGSSNLECIINKKDIAGICGSLRGETFS